MNRTARLYVTAALLTVAPVLAPRAASAQSVARQAITTAQALYDQAMSAIAQKDYAHACPKLEEVTRLVPEGVGAKLTLAECYEGQDRLASAWTTYTLAEAAAARAKQDDRQALAQQRATALKPKLAQLTIIVSAEVQALPGIEVRCDDVVVGQAAWNVAFPVDKGTHLITAAATRVAPWNKSIEVRANGDRVSVVVGGLKVMRPAAPPPEGVLVAKAPQPKQNEGNQPFPVQKTLGLIAGGLGLVGISAGTIFGVNAIQKKADSNDGHCREGDRCDPPGLTLREDAIRAGTLSTAMFVAGGVALAGGVVLFVTTPNQVKTAAMKVVVRGSGVELVGRW